MLRRAPGPVDQSLESSIQQRGHWRSPPRIGTKPPIRSCASFAVRSCVCGRACYGASSITALVASGIVLLATVNDAHLGFLVSGFHPVRPLGRALVGRRKLAVV